MANKENTAAKNVKMLTNRSLTQPRARQEKRKLKMESNKESKMSDETRNLLERASEEISSLRRQNEKLSIRIEAIDDMLMVLHSKPAAKSQQGMAPDIVWEIDKAVRANT